MLLTWLPQPLYSYMSMVVSDHAEERLARVERMLAQCQRQNVALKAVAASKVVVIVVKAAPLGSTQRIQPTKPKRSD
jgi:hypothetical protein